MAHTALPDDFRPGYDERHPHSSFLHGGLRPTLSASPWECAVEPLGRRGCIVGRAIVGSEYDQGVFVKSPILELPDQLAYLMVEIADHRRIGSVRITAREIVVRPRADVILPVVRSLVTELGHIMVHPFLRCLERRMRERGRPHQEERIPGILVDEMYDTLVHHVRAVYTSSPVFVIAVLVQGISAFIEGRAWDRGVRVDVNLPVIFPIVLRIVVVGDPLADAAIVVVESHLPWHALRYGSSKPPFAHHSGDITRLLHHGTQGRSPCGKAGLAFQCWVQVNGAVVPDVGLIRSAGTFLVVPDLRVPRMLTRDKAAA